MINMRSLEASKVKRSRSMSFLKEFRDFAIKGNAVDMAVGIIIGAAFGKIVSSLVNDIIMPPIGFLLGGVDFSDLTLNLKSPSGTTAGVAIKYGLFLNTIIDFAIIAFCIYLVVRGMNALIKQKPEAQTMKKCPECQMDIPISAKRCGHCTSRLEG